jgi:hypothetical protein
MVASDNGTRRSPALVFGVPKMPTASSTVRCPSFEVNAVPPQREQLAASPARRRAGMQTNSGVDGRATG